MGIKGYIEDILKAMVAEGIIKNEQYNNKYYGNLVWGTKPLPGSQFSLAPIRTLSLKGGIRHNAATVKVSFADKTPINSDGDIQEEVIEKMMDIGNDFVKRCIKDSRISVRSEEVIMIAFEQKTDTNITGVELSIDIKEKKAYCI